MQQMLKVSVASREESTSLGGLLEAGTVLKVSHMLALFIVITRNLLMTTSGSKLLMWTDLV